MRTTVLRWRESADHELLLAVNLALQPRTRPTVRFIQRARHFRDDALESLGSNCRQQIRGLHFKHRRESDGPALLSNHALERLLSLLDRHIQQRSAVMMQQVE